LTAFVFSAGHGGGRYGFLIIGSRHPRPNLLPVSRASIAEVQPTTEVKVEAPSDDPLRAIAARYFNRIRVLWGLDVNADLAISAGEIAAAPVLLLKLDKDHDGNLSPDECGFTIGDPVQFMRNNPVLAALDRDHDGVISEAEIRNSPAALRSLD